MRQTSGCTELDREHWQTIFRAILNAETESDPAHDLPHVERVVANAVNIGTVERADLGVLFPAAWLHDCVHVPKDSPDRSRASLLAADRAVEFLQERQYPERFLEGIHHAIVAHSFSAGVAPRTLEAQVLQDADRLDALGAVGLSRMLMLGGFMQKPLFSPRDPFCRERAPDDGRYVIDHLFAKLFKLADRMHTDAGRAMAVERTAFLEEYVRRLEGELAGSI